jgi:hypothetical protein
LGVAPKRCFVRHFNPTKGIYSKIRDREAALAIRDACAIQKRAVNAPR